MPCDTTTKGASNKALASPSFDPDRAIRSRPVQRRKLSSRRCDHANTAGLVQMEVISLFTISHKVKQGQPLTFRS
ncbi:protein of unknown function [Candidatus Nitrospira inopinata]|uniref:Uncharacterized protein n=1 Tax=Candidatus Nitrospira inopinata TaxID=1715989 RepID=A0A0S4KRJ2_9BACT|nr:protein of unknown function [Candidatus Nitrospira inopinata]